jgi:hypothetical protein
MSIEPISATDIGNQLTAHQPRQRLADCRTTAADAEAVRVGRLAVADNEVAELALRRLDGVIGLAGRPA